MVAGSLLEGSTQSSVTCPTKNEPPGFKSARSLFAESCENVTGVPTVRYVKAISNTEHEHRNLMAPKCFDSFLFSNCPNSSQSFTELLTFKVTHNRTHGRNNMLILSDHASPYSLANRRFYAASGAVNKIVQTGVSGPRAINVLLDFDRAREERGILGRSYKK